MCRECLIRFFLVVRSFPGEITPKKRQEETNIPLQTKRKKDICFSPFPKNHRTDNFGKSKLRFRTPWTSTEKAPFSACFLSRALKFWFTKKTPRYSPNLRDLRTLCETRLLLFVSNGIYQISRVEKVSVIKAKIYLTFGGFFQGFSKRSPKISKSEAASSRFQMFSMKTVTKKMLRKKVFLWLIPICWSNVPLGVPINWKNPIETDSWNLKIALLKEEIPALEKIMSQFPTIIKTSQLRSP